jgi:myotubularin-related protein 1/2
MNISAAKRESSPPNSNVYKISIRTKDLRTVQLLFQGKETANQQCELVLKQLMKGSSGEVMEQLFAFQFKAQERKKKFACGSVITYDEYRCYDPRKEYRRLGMDAGKSPWLISDINMNYELCDTYPQILCVPSMMSAAELHKISEFRSRHRVRISVGTTWN